MRYTHYCLRVRGVPVGDATQLRGRALRADRPRRPSPSASLKWSEASSSRPSREETSEARGKCQVNAPQRLHMDDGSTRDRHGRGQPFQPSQSWGTFLRGPPEFSLPKPCVGHSGFGCFSATPTCLDGGARARWRSFLPFAACAARVPAAPGSPRAGPARAMDGQFFRGLAGTPCSFQYKQPPTMLHGARLSVHVRTPRVLVLTNLSGEHASTMVWS
jgi:hypothetical protein